MNNKPYIFCNSKKNLQQIHLVLEKIGLTIVSRTSAYNEEKWMLSCPWKNDDKISLSWKKKFWPDGINEEDDYVELVVNEIGIGKVDIDFLRNQKHENSLNMIILEEIKKS